MTPTQGEHAQTEALDDLYLKLHGMSKRLESSGRIDESDAPEAYPAILDAMNLVRRLQCESAQVAALTPTPECLTCNDHGAVGNILTAEPCPDCTPAQPAAPQGVAEVNWWEADGDKYDDSITRAPPAPTAQAAPTNPHWDYLKRYWQMGFDGVSLDACTGDAPIKAWHEGKAARESMATTPTAHAAPAADPAYSEACSLATALFEKHYRQEPDYASGRVVWSLCDTTAGVISQIDNMVSGLARAPAAGAVAGMPPGISALMCVISSLRDTAHFSDEEGELTDELRTLRDWAMTQAAAPTPAAQADSVLEDAARWQALPAFYEEYQIDAMKLYRDIDAYLDAARKQGGA